MSTLESTPDLDGFDPVYRQHVASVVAGDLKAVLADMAEGSVPEVFAGVETPQGALDGADVRSVRVEDGRGIGESVYSVGGSTIGLRSGWAHDGRTWKADTLENFQP